MKLNEKSLAFYATCDSPADNAGFLHKKGERNTAYHRRWFVLKGNLLFYFEERESREPVGVIVLEGCTVELCEATQEFTFAIKFDCARSRTYTLAAESQAAMESWVKSLSRASFDYLRLVVKELERQLEEMQRSLSGYHRVQRRQPLYRRNKAGPDSDPATPGCPDLLREKPAVPICVPAKENGCALWNNSDGSTNVPSGCTQVNPGPERVSDGPKLPPLPPRRRALSGNPCDPGLDGPSYPGHTCFSRLHAWYGKEILELRRAWLESQKGYSLGRESLAEGQLWKQ